MSLTFVLYFIVPTLLGLIILATGAVLWFLIWRRSEKAGTASFENWQSTGGKVLATRIEEREGGFEPVVHYAYHAAGQDYEGDQVFAEGARKLEKSAAERVLASFTVNGYIQVRYNPNNPAQSALMQGQTKTDYLLMAAYLFTAFGVAVCCFTSFMAITVLGGIGGYM